MQKIETTTKQNKKKTSEEFVITHQSLGEKVQ